jgi:hypothetical protein
MRACLEFAMMGGFAAAGFRLAGLINPYLPF